MINQADLQTISTVFGVNPDELSGVLSSEEEKPLGLRLNGRVLTQSEEKELRESGVQQGKQIGYKEIANGLELTLESGEKDPLIIAEKLKTNLTSIYEEKYKNQTPTEELEKAKEEVEKLTTKYDKLLSTYDEKEKELISWSEKYNTLEEGIVKRDIDNEIKKYLSAPDKASGLTIDQQLALFKRDHNEPTKKDGIIVYSDNKGETITDSVGGIETSENVVKSWLEKQSFTKNSKGMGGGDSGSDTGGVNGGKTPDEAWDIIKKKGITPASPEGLKLYSELTKKAS